VAIFVAILPFYFTLDRIENGKNNERIPKEFFWWMVIGAGIGDGSGKYCL
jgi:hypothetical protein